MKRKLLYIVILTILLTACGSTNAIKEVKISEEDFLEYDTEKTPQSPDETSYAAPEDLKEDSFTETGYFKEYAVLANPASVAGIEYVGKDNDRYLFTFPDDEAAASQLYNEYGALIQKDGFTVEEYEGNYIIKNGGEPVAFMGTGYNAEHKYIMMMAFYPEK